MRGLPALARIFTAVILLSPLALASMWILAFSLSVLAVLHLRAAVALLATELFLSAILIFFTVARKFPAALTRMAIVSFLFFNTFLLIPLCFLIWKPPHESECEKYIVPGIVEKLNSCSTASTLSASYDLLYIPEKKIVVASFKMLGNLMLKAWDPPTANRLVLVDVSDARKPELSEFSLAGPRLVECMDWDPADETLFITRVGFGEHAVTAVSLKEFPRIKKTWTRRIDFEPNGIVVNPADQTLIVTGIEGVVARLDPRGGWETKPRWRIHLPDGGVNAIDTYRPPGSKKIYLAMVGWKIAEIDIETDTPRFARVPFGGGQLATDPESGLLFQTDIVFDALNVIDIDSMTLKKRIKLGYKPRAIQADPQRDLLMVGNWPRGEVNFYRLSTLKRLRFTVRTGRYLRNFAYDEERG
ncbi:MAG: hypothetical protein ABIH66_11130, partial [bacterium]